MEISSRKLIPLFRQGSVHSDSASWDDCDRVFPDELCELVSWYCDRFPHYAGWWTEQVLYLPTSPHRNEKNWSLARDQQLQELKQVKWTTPQELHLMVRSSQSQSALSLFSKTTWPRALLTLCSLSKEVCLYMGTGWLSSSVSQRVARGQLHLKCLMNKNWVRKKNTSTNIFIRIVRMLLKLEIKKICFQRENNPANVNN